MQVGLACDKLCCLADQLEEFEAGPGGLIATDVDNAGAPNNKDHHQIDRQLELSERQQPTGKIAPVGTWGSSFGTFIFDRASI